MSFVKLDPTRAEIENSLNSSEIRSLVKDSTLKVLQCSEPIRVETWDRINDEFLSERPEILLRIYGFYGLTCDLAILPRLGRLRHLRVDCLMNATGIQHVEHLQNLDSLNVGIFSLDNFDFLSLLPTTVSGIGLGATKSKKPRLGLLGRFGRLNKLYIESQQKDIEVLSELKTLEDVTLRSVSTDNLEYLRKIPNLTSVDIKLGGIRDLSALQEKASIRYLELWMIRGLTDISVISTLYGLQFLFLQSLKHIRALPDLSKLNKLRRIYMEDMKSLADILSLETVISLEDLAHVGNHKFTPDDYGFLTRMPNIRTAIIGFGSQKKFDVMKAKLRAAGIQEYARDGFEFV